MMQTGKLIKNCPHCGRVSVIHENYCPNCGSRLRPPAKYCPKHGKMSGNYCYVCGSRLLTDYKQFGNSVAIPAIQATAKQILLKLFS
nr:MAG TPA: putative cytoplasmic protein [Caudoviricetes sp.]